VHEPKLVVKSGRGGRATAAAAAATTKTALTVRSSDGANVTVTFDQQCKKRIRKPLKRMIL